MRGICLDIFRDSFGIVDIERTFVELLYNTLYVADLTSAGNELVRIIRQMAVDTIWRRRIQLDWPKRESYEDPLLLPPHVPRIEFVHVDLSLC